MLKMNGLYRRNGKKIYIKQPELNELNFTAKLWADPETMAEIGGAYEFPREKWEIFYKKMVQPTDGKNFYCLIYTIRDKVVGEVSFHGYDPSTKAARVNIKIHHRHRGKGFGEEALRLLLEYYFFEFGGVTIIDTVKTDAAKKLLLKIGFEAIGNFKNEVTFKLGKDSFNLSDNLSNQNVAVIAFDNMDIMEYSLPFKIFEFANQVKGEKIFNVFGISRSDRVKSSIGCEICGNEIFDNVNIKPNIIVIPGGSDIEESIKDKTLIKYLMSNNNESDYIIAFSNSIHFLNRCRMIDGLLVPKMEENDKLNSDIRLTNESFADNGKIALSANVVGAIEVCTNVIKKILGEDVYDEVNLKLGIERKTEKKFTK